MAVSSVSSKATTALKDITAAANHKPAKPISLNAEVFHALEKKLVALARKDAPKASGLVDLMEELHKKGTLQLNFNTGPLPWGASNAWNSAMNNIKEVLNNNAVTSDDKPTSPLMK